MGSGAARLGYPVLGAQGPWWTDAAGGSATDAWVLAFFWSKLLSVFLLVNKSMRHMQPIKVSKVYAVLWRPALSLEIKRCNVYE